MTENLRSTCASFPQLEALFAVQRFKALFTFNSNSVEETKTPC